MRILFNTRRLAPGAALLALALAACTVQKQSTPALSGPSSLGLTLSLSASPAILPRDGSSVSTIMISTKDHLGSPVQQKLLLSATAGTLSDLDVTTDANGLASVRLTAPGKNQPVTSTVVTATPVEDADVGTPISASRTVTVGFLGPKVPVASFTFSPESPGQFDQVIFDATATTLDGDPCSTKCQYVFDFGDGSSATAQIAAHRYNTRGSFNATLTVTSIADGTVATKVETVTVGDPAALTASFTFSPTDPLVGDIVIVNANSSSTPDGATIVAYDWDFGCQTSDTPTCTTPTASGSTASTVYNAARTYTVRLTITDSVGRTATTTKTVLVK